MKTALVIFFIAIVVQNTLSSGLKAFVADFQVTASQYNDGFFNGQLYYDWNAYSFLLTFPVADEYSELYIFNSGQGYDTTLLNGQFSGQYLYRNSSHCLCETTSLLNSMPPFFLDPSVTPVAVWSPDPNSQPMKYGTSNCVGYILDSTGSPSQQLVNYFWQTSGGIPCGFNFTDGRTFTLTNVAAASIPSSRWETPVDCKCGKPLDVVVSLDRTGSIQVWEWYIQHNFTQHLVDAFDYGPLKTNLGIVDWNSNFWITLDLTAGIDQETVDKAVASMGCCTPITSIYASCCCCGTPIGGGLYYAAQMMLTSVRTTATKVIILLTDGCQNHIYDPSTTPPTVTACDCATEQSCQTDVACINDIEQHYQEVTAVIPGIKILAVGVGTDQTICQAQLDTVAGNIMANVFRPQSWQDLSNLVQSISATACDVEDKTCTGCCGICSCGSCVKPINCTVPNKCSVAAVDPISGCCSVAPLTCPQKPCFISSCDPVLGCQYTPLQCPLGGNCTEWYCDNSTSSITSGTCLIKTVCVAPQCRQNKDCDDNNACTVDTCTQAGNCSFTPVNCGTSNNCSTFTCDMVTGCKNTTKVCNDYNLCTKDSCVGSVNGGCVFAPIKCNVSADGCYISKCSPSVGCYNEIKACNLTTNNCTVVACVNGSCGRENICIPPPPPAGSETNEVAIVGGTIGAAALAGICIGAVALFAGLAGGASAAYAHAGGAAGSNPVVNNPLYVDNCHKGTSPLYIPAK